MIRLRLAGLLITCVVAAEMIPAATAPLPAPVRATGPAEIDRLIRQLGSEDFDEREAAGKGLIAIGYPALDALLKTMATSDDAEVRQQARKVVEVLAPRYPELCSLRGHTAGVNGVAISPDGQQVVSVAHDQTIRVWDLRVGKEVRCLKDEQEGVVTAVAFSPDGKLALTGGADQLVRLWDTATWTELRRFKGHRHCVFRVAFSPNGRLGVSACSQATVRVWNLETGEQLHCISPNRGANVQAVAFSADGTKILAAHHDGIRVWKLDTEEEVLRLPCGLVALSPASQRAVSSADRTLNLLDLEKGAVLRTCQIKADGKSADEIHGIRAVAISPDGKRALSASANHMLRLWDVNTGEQLQCIDIPRGSASHLTFSPDGSRAATGGSDGTVRIWHVPR